MEGISLKLTPVVVKRFLGSLGMFGLLADIYLFDSELLRTVLMEGTTCFKLPTLHQHQHILPPPAHPPHIRAIIMAVKNLHKIQ